MKIPIYQVDAFTSTVFAGNPAAVCILDAWLDDELMQSVAAENNLSETAFLVPTGEGFEIRWFTPVAEVWLCGHATLASAYVQFFRRSWNADEIRFETRKSGHLIVKRREGLLEMDFPARPPQGQVPPDDIGKILGLPPVRVMYSREDLLVVLDDEEAVRQTRPDFSAIAQLSWRAVIVTARGSRSDFVSRFFAPKVGVPEDPVTGSAHTVLIPYWSGILHKKELYALQLSQRGGELWCQDAGDRVKISGQAALYLEGAIMV
jgi:PhzF family phenazine biosynthesis protein